MKYVYITFLTILQTGNKLNFLGYILSSLLDQQQNSHINYKQSGLNWIHLWWVAVQWLHTCISCTLSQECWWLKSLQLFEKLTQLQMFLLFITLQQWLLKYSSLKSCMFYKKWIYRKFQSDKSWDMKTLSMFELRKFSP